MKFYKWTVEFQVADTLVADGFDLTEERALSMLAHDLGWAAIGAELKAKVVKAPNHKAILKEQGFARTTK